MTKHQQAVGIYRLFKLGRLAGSNEFDPEIKKLEMDLHPIHHDYVEKVNEKATVGGLLYELDQKATDLYWEGKPYRTEEAGEAAKAKTENKAGGKGANEKAGTTKKETKKPEEVKPEDKDAKIAELKAEYLKLTGNEAPPIWGLKKLTEQIEIEAAKAK